MRRREFITLLGGAVTPTARVIDLVLMRRRSGEEAMVYVLNIFAALEFLAGLFLGMSRSMLN